MRWSDEPYVTLTHIPTGISARSNCGRRKDMPGNLEDSARKLLTARLYAPVPQARVERTYNLAPARGGQPFIREGGRVVATGIQPVLDFLDGKIC